MPLPTIQMYSGCGGVCRFERNLGSCLRASAGTRWDFSSTALACLLILSHSSWKQWRQGMQQLTYMVEVQQGCIGIYAVCNCDFSCIMLCPPTYRNFFVLG